MFRKNKREDNSMDFIAYTFIRMREDGVNVNIHEFTQNMPGNLRHEFYRYIDEYEQENCERPEPVEEY